MNYVATASRAAAQIKKAGQAIAIRRVTKGAFDSNTGKNAPGVSTDFPGHAVSSGYHASLVDGTRIKQGDQQFTVAASGLGCEPSTSDFLVDARQTWTIVSVQDVAPAGEPLLYKIQARGN